MLQTLSEFGPSRRTCLWILMFTICAGCAWAVLNAQSCPSSCAPPQNPNVQLGGFYDVCIATETIGDSNASLIQNGIDAYWSNRVGGSEAQVVLWIQRHATCSGVSTDITVRVVDFSQISNTNRAGEAEWTNNGRGAEIQINPNTWESQLDQDGKWRFFGAHEFGHILGLTTGGNLPSSCNDYSIMAEAWHDPANTSMLCGDGISLQDAYPMPVDVDGDGFWQQYDCEDEDQWIYPGAVDTNPYCGWPDAMPPWFDYNCNGVNDYSELSVACPGYQSPILIDVEGDGFYLTDESRGVVFDLNSDGLPEFLPWTEIGSNDAWLVLDRTGNGLIDNGTELFGNYTPQPMHDTPNGFLALALYDAPEAGGNDDGWIDASDGIFDLLNLWQDADHNGLSQPTELFTLGELGVVRVGLSYHEVGQRDEWGNWFRFRAPVVGNKGQGPGRFAVDVFLGFFASPSEGPRGVRRSGR